MENFDDLKKSWAGAMINPGVLDESSMKKILKKRISHHTRQAYNYFWASLVLQITMYALLSHLVIRFRGNLDIVLLAVGGMLLFLPFTIVLMKKFKAMAVAPLSGSGNDSVLTYIHQQRQQLENILQFKTRYEIILIPLINAVGVAIPFMIYIPGGLSGNLQLGIILYFLSLAVCYFANRSENQASFIRPIKKLDEVLLEYNAAG